MVGLAECAPSVFPPALHRSVAGLFARLLRRDPYLDIDTALPVVGVVVARGVGMRERAVFHLDGLIVVRLEQAVESRTVGIPNVEGVREGLEKLLGRIDAVVEV